MDKPFICPKYSSFEDQGLYISASTELTGGVPLIHSVIEKLRSHHCAKSMSFDRISFVEDVPNGILARIGDCFGIPFSDRSDAYTVIIGSGIEVYSRSERGLFYGTAALAGLARDGYLKRGLFYEAPVLDVRGAKVYLPGRASIPYFKEFVNFLAAFRMNTLMLEIGGAMEYKKHPEINTAWVRYCAEMSEYSGKTDMIQYGTQEWEKNSIHVENGQGNYLTQEEVADIAAYCRERYINIIPEVPSLSHCDYLLLAHPELRERANDEYADAYCPSHEGSYALLFDVLDEVIDVFRPKEINIGHDEWYSVGVCEKCREKDPAKLYADDITHIYNYLKERGIRAIIWGEKLLDARVHGEPAGGAHIMREAREEIPAIYPSADMLPSDLGILHWYWEFDAAYDEEYRKRGMTFTFGNFVPLGFKNWRTRISRSGVEGALVSNWSSLKEENIQRNGMYFDLAYSNLLFWEDDFSIIQESTFAERAMEMLYAYRYRNVRHGLRILHTTDLKIAYQQFYDGHFIVHSDYDLGVWELTLASGKIVTVPVEYGMNISSSQNEWNFTDRSLPEVSYTTLPRRIQAEGKEIVVYEFIVETGSEGIQAVTYKPTKNHSACITLYGLTYY